MTTLPQTFVEISPRELKFDNVKLNESYSQTVQLQNTLSYSVNIEIKPGNSFRYKINETNITLQSNETKDIEIQLRLTKSISPKALKIKDIFYIKSDFFNDHISSSITMAPHHDNNNHHQNDNFIPSQAIHNEPVNSSNNNNENNKLKDYIVNLENNVSEMKIELDYLRSIKTQINSSIPDLETIVDATIGKERALNEVRNKKVLHILQTKDEEIENLKEMSKNYQSVQVSLNVLQKKYVDLTQVLNETQNENKDLTLKLNQHKQEILKLNDKISSYSQQSQFQKKIVRERDLRIKELTNDIQETQNMLQRTTKTMKHSYNEQINELQSKFDESNKIITDLTNKFNEKEIKYKNDLISLKQITKENKLLNQYKNERENAFKKELNDIKNNQIMNNPINNNNDVEKINYLQIELAKLRSFVRLGLFNNNENIINYQNGKNINKEIMNELARKSAHLSASQAIIQQQKDRISELEKLQKMTNESVFKQSLKLNETNKKLTNNSSETQRLLNIHKRQIQILNKKLSDSINREEAIKIKLQNTRKQLNVSETEYIDKIEELEQALKAINTMHQKTKRTRFMSAKSSTSSSLSSSSQNGDISRMIQLENKLTISHNDLKSLHQKLNKEMNERQLDIKAYNIKLQNTKKLYQQQINRLKSIIEQFENNKSRNRDDDNMHRVIQLNNELAQSEKLKNEYLTELEIIKNKYQQLENQNEYELRQRQENEIFPSTMNGNRDQLLLEMNEKCYKQKEEIEQLSNMMNAAITV